MKLISRVHAQLPYTMGEYYIMKWFHYRPLLGKQVHNMCSDISTDPTAIILSWMYL